jgi:hypothetical protein
MIGGTNYAKLENLRYKEQGLEGVSGYTKINTSALTTYVNIKNGFQLKTNYTQDTYVFVHAVDGSGNGRLYQNQTAIPDQGAFDTSEYLDTSGNAFRADASANLTGRFSNAPGGNMAYCNAEESVIYAGQETRCGAVFTCDNATGDNPEDHTLKANNTLDTTAESFTWDETNHTDMHVFTTRPIRGIRFQFKTVNAAAGTTLTPYYWSGSAWVEITAGGHTLSDGTISGGISLAQDGWVTWDYQGTSTEKPRHFEELYMYAYRFEVDSAGNNASSVIHTLTVESPMQDILDLWDGVYRQPIQCQFHDSSTNKVEDYTVHVNETSDLNTPIGLELDGMTDVGPDALYIMFEDKMTAIKFTMLSSLVNTNASVSTLNYWDGDSWTDTSATDGTIVVGGKTFSGTGSFTWTPPADEQPQLAFGTTGYMYQITVSAVLSGTHGDATEEVYVDLITGIPAQKTLPAWEFPVQYKTRLMLANYGAAGEGNRVDYCVSNTADAWNGLDSSDNGLYSLYFGGNQPLTAGTQLYNRYGSNIFATLIMLKDNETYLMVGDTPDDFRIYPVSYTVGCPAPLTLATAEANLAPEGQPPIHRNIAIWLSHRGPVMFDGAMLIPIDGINSYFDPAETSKAINTDAIKNSRGWYDSMHEEYNLLIPTVANTNPDKWFIYSLKYKGWYEKNVSTATFPLCGFEVKDEFGSAFVLGGLTTGYMMHFDNGTTWDGVGITQKIRTGDIFASQSIWDEIRIRKFKLILRRIDESATLNIRYYGDTAAESGVGVTFMTASLAASTAGGNEVSFTDSTDNNVSWATPTSTTIDVSLATGLQRLIRKITNLNRTGWAHAFEFDVTTSSSRKGFQPVLWGVRYQITRKDDTAT